MLRPMAHHVIRTGGIISAPIDRVWSILADARSYRDWGVMSVSTLEREGSPEPDGVGAIRNLGTGAVMSREEVVVFDPPHHLGYVLLSGLPIENYRADVWLSELGVDRTRIVWSGSFDATGVTGRIMVPFLRFTLADFVRRLSKTATSRQ